MVRMAERTLSDMQGRPLFVSRRFFFFLIFHPSGCQAMFLHASGRRDGLPREGVMAIDRFWNSAVSRGLNPANEALPRYVATTPRHL